jgi:membrane-bound serine protease (ClpP class)
MVFVDMITSFEVIGAVLFIAGIVLIIVEMFQPGFGVFGAVGVSLLIVNIFVTANTLAQGVILAVFTFAIFLLLFIIFLILMSKGRLPQKMILRETESNFKGTEDMQYLLGKTGVVVTTCRPAGKINVEGSTYDVVTLGEFIEKDKAVEIVEVEGNRVVVRETAPVQ